MIFEESCDTKDRSNDAEKLKTENFDDAEN